MGFDVLYLPPIHPIGRSFRKGPNNTLTAGPDDPGSPWAIGSARGRPQGHPPRPRHPRRLRPPGRRRLASSASRSRSTSPSSARPTTPTSASIPQWFRHRPDGTIKYAENPPKKYQDIYPIDFECDDWQALWDELRDVFLFWVGHGVKIFRVDNPHTKPFRFWEWVIAEVWTEHPDVDLPRRGVHPAQGDAAPGQGRLLAVVHLLHLAEHQAGADRVLHRADADRCRPRYMRPNLFANTPDILHEYLQYGGRPAFQIRLVLAATLGRDLRHLRPAVRAVRRHRPLRHGSEEYLDSEKYQVRHWDRDDPESLRDYIARINAIRRENPALHHDRNLRFYPIDNDQILVYGKATPDLSNIVLVASSTSTRTTPSRAGCTLPLAELGLAGGPGESYQVHDLIGDARYLWHGESNFVQLDPAASPAQVFRVRRKIKTEKDFDYYF